MLKNNGQEKFLAFFIVFFGFFIFNYYNSIYVYIKACCGYGALRVTTIQGYNSKGIRDNEMKGKDLALIERNIRQELDKIKKDLEKGASLGEVNNFYVETVESKLNKIRAELDKIEF